MTFVVSLLLMAVSTVSDNPNKLAAPPMTAPADLATAFGLCRSLIAEPRPLRERMKELGWEDVSNDLNVEASLRQPEAGVFARPPLVMMFVSKNAKRQNSQKTIPSVCIVTGRTSSTLQQIAVEFSEKLQISLKNNSGKRYRAKLRDVAILIEKPRSDANMVRMIIGEILSKSLERTK